MDFTVTAPLKTVEGSDIAVLMEDIGRQAKSAARALALAPTAQKNEALAAMAAAIRARKVRHPRGKCAGPGGSQDRRHHIGVSRPPRAR